MQLPQGTVTFLFTDLEGSTRRWEAHPQEMRDALARHNAIVRGAVESHDGAVFSTMGDGASGGVRVGPRRGSCRASRASRTNRRKLG
jgi:class 3 adenylate cyclase